MDGVMENAGVVCGVLVAAELITRLCPKNKMLGFVRSLTVLVLLASLAAALAGASWGLVLTGGGGGLAQPGAGPICGGPILSGGAAAGGGVSSGPAGRCGNGGEKNHRAHQYNGRQPHSIYKGRAELPV